jgi:hypothetical protein
MPFIFVMVGCVATLPSDDGLTADIAAETARMVVQLRQQITPTPAPPKDGKCIPCNGTGTLPTDGRIVIKCEACGGTGKAKK